MRGLNTAATLWCSAMVGTFAGAGQLVASALAATFVISTSLFLRPIVQLINKQPLGAGEAETHYAVEVRCHGQEEAHIRALFLQAASNAGLGLRRLTSENLEDSPQVTVSALLVSANRHDAALEQIVGRMSLEPFVTAVHWQVEQAAAESREDAQLCLRVFLPSVENAVYGYAMRLLYIVRTRKWLTVQIGNIDAAGRLVLAEEETTPRWLDRRRL